MKIRRILLDSANQELSPAAELLLYFRLARAERGRVDSAGAGARRDRALPTASPIPRWSTRAAAAGSAQRRVMALDRIACRGLKPDLTILVDVDAEASLARARARNVAEPHCETRMDDQSLEFHRRVHEAYHALAAARAGAGEGGRRPRRHRTPSSAKCGAS